MYCFFLLKNISCLNIFILVSIYKALEKTHILFYVTLSSTWSFRSKKCRKSKINILRTFYIIRESVIYFCIYFFRNVICISLNDRADNGKWIGDDVEGRRPRPTLRFCPNVCLEQDWSICCVVLTTTAKFGVRAGNMKFNTQHEKLININIILYTILPVYYSVQYVK